ncbi:hypothetical protein GCM10010211_30710 [Streptomyces albospinus]|uniref:CdiI immunity protein domain-containing protein n=1 Tax=Streptomyces albospinus TaxID=285515 RepID=A0ABQ2V2Y9_9ACTN|nr:hypothetical protein [Streptomyces albospinus]GGU63533.1 hypothetical protein GCM10010211_30710 [Streptomyces albospinus]
MRTYIGNQEIASDTEFEELAFGFDEFPLGIDHDLFRGPLGGESPEEQAARLDVAREVLRDLQEQGEAGDEVAAWDALYADALTAVAPLWIVRGTGRVVGREVAA